MCPEKKYPISLNCTKNKYHSIIEWLYFIWNGKLFSKGKKNKNKKRQKRHLSCSDKDTTIMTPRMMLVFENHFCHHLAFTLNTTAPTNKQKSNWNLNLTTCWIFLCLFSGTPGALLRRSSLKVLQPMTAVFTAGSCTPLIFKMCSRSASVTYKHGPL